MFLCIWAFFHGHEPLRRQQGKGGDHCFLSQPRHGLTLLYLT